MSRVGPPPPLESQDTLGVSTAPAVRRHMNSPQTRRLSARRQIRRQTSGGIWTFPTRPQSLGERTPTTSSSSLGRHDEGRADSVAVPLAPADGEPGGKYLLPDAPAAIKSAADEPEDGHDGSKFGQSCTPSYLLACVLSAVVIFVLMQAFCIVFSLIVMDEPPFNQHIGIGMDIQTATAFVSMLMGAFRSRVGASISGPDIIAALMFSAMGKIIAKETAAVPEQAMPTLIAAQLLSTAVVAVSWMVLARFRWTRVVSYMPVSVVMGFLGCIGYKVAKEAIHQATGKAWYHPEGWEFWKLLLPALGFGLALYFMKRFHVLNPLILLPLFLFVPVGVFYIIAMGILGLSMQDLRKLGWMYPSVHQTNFYLPYTYLEPALVNGGAIAKCIPLMLILLLIVTIDMLLKLKSTAAELHCEVDVEHSVQLNALESVGSMLVLGPPGYMQVKFNILNYSIINNSTERRVGVVVSLLLGALWLSGLPLMNILPRFFLGGLLLYVAMPFIEKNLIMSYRRLTKLEFAAVWAIVLTNAIAGVWSSQSLLFAILAGLAISFIIFSVQSGHIRAVRSRRSGRDYQSLVVRPYEEMVLLDRISHRFLIIELQNFLFFGSAAQVLDLVKTVIAESDADRLSNHVRYILFDFAHVLDCDYSATATFREILDMLTSHSIEAYCSGMTERVHRRFHHDGLLVGDGFPASAARASTSDDNHHAHAHAHAHTHAAAAAAEGHHGLLTELPDLDEAAELVEERMILRAEHVRKKWLLFPAALATHERALRKASYELVGLASMGHDAALRLWKYLEAVQVAQDDVIFSEGDCDNNVYMLHAGRITAFAGHEESEYRRLHTITKGWFNTEGLSQSLPCTYSTVADEDCDLVVLSAARLAAMERDEPDLLVTLMRSILQAEALLRERLKREVKVVDLAINYQRQQVEVAAEEPHVWGGGAGAPSAPAGAPAAPAAATTATAAGLATATASTAAAPEAAVAPRPAKSPSRPNVVEGGWLLNDEHHQPFGFFGSLFAHGRGPFCRAPDGRSLGGSADTPETPGQLHLSGRLRGQAQLVFLVHSGAARKLSAEQRRSLDTNAMDAATRFTVTRLLGTAKLPTSRLQSALHDLGLFPSADEVHGCQDESIGSEPMGFPRFLRVFEALLFHRLNPVQRRQLLLLFVEQADGGVAGHMGHRGLSAALKRLGRNMEERDVELLLQEWQVDERERVRSGSEFASSETSAAPAVPALDWEAFLSLASVCLKHESADDALELDFLKLAGTISPHVEGAGWGQGAHVTTPPLKLLEEVRAKMARGKDGRMFVPVVTPDGLCDVYRRLGLELEAVDAQDMVFDASSGEGTCVTVAEFCKVVNMVSGRELLHDCEIALPRAAKHGSSTVDWHSVAHGVISRFKVIHALAGQGEPHTQDSEV